MGNLLYTKLMSHCILFVILKTNELWEIYLAPKFKMMLCYWLMSHCFLLVILTRGSAH